MRITYILLFAFIFNVHADGLAQNVTLKASNLTLKEVLVKLHNSTGYNFIYNLEMLGNASKVSVDVQNSPLANALNQILTPYSLSYSINANDKIVVITKAQNAPPIQVRGSVTDENKQPLPGVNIRIKGGTLGGVSGADGRFSITVPNAGAVLMFSMVGYETKEITVTNGAALNIVLRQVASKLDDIVVVGYGTQRKSDLTGSVASIKEREISQAKTVSFMEAMQGRLAGVQVTSSSGEPGAAVNVTIRGTNTFVAGAQPLYVIDGVQIDINNAEAANSGIGNTQLSNPLAGINPADIASMEVLKDASATAIFGSRGANGVVVITTKSGKNNSSSLDINTYGGLAWTPKKLNMLGAQDYAYYRFATNTADNTYAIDVNNDKIFDQRDQVRDLSNVQSINWQQEALRVAASQSYNVNYSGGNAKTTFLTSASYLNQQGLLLNNKYERYGLLMKVNHNATDRLKVGANINLSHAIGSGVASNGGNDVRNYNGILQTLLLTRPINAPDPFALATDPDGATFSSPVDFANLSYKRSPLSRILADVNANYRIINGLNIDVRGGAIFTFSKNGEFYPSTVSWGYPSNGLAVLNTSNTVNWYQTSTLTYNKRFAKIHSVTLLGGFEVNSYTQETFRWGGQGFDVQNINPLDNISTANVLPYPATTEKQRYVRVSQFARLNYSLMDKYLLTATIRNDASSKLSEGNKSALFPSVGLAWRVSRENFLKNVSAISDLKLRGSFGLTGNERIPPYQSLATLSAVYYSTANNNSSLGYAPNISANPKLTWETTHAYDAGVDLSLLADRISFTADVYLKQTKELLLQADIPAQSGFMRQWQNMGQIDNRGIELALNTVNIRTKNFNWNSNLNISMNRNKVQSLGSVSFIPVTVYGGSVASVGRVIVGQQIGTAYGYVFDGVYQKSDFTARNSAGTVIDPSTITDANLTTFTYTPNAGVPNFSLRAPKPGDFKYKDLNNDGVVNEQDRTIISQSSPKHYGGFSNNFNYKNFDLSVLFNWSYGNEVLNLGRGRYEATFSQYANVTTEYWNNRWTATNPSNSYAGISSAASKTDVSSYYVEDASFLRLRNVTFGYTLSKAPFLKKIGVNGLRVYVTAVNLYTWTGYRGFDPEVSSYSALLPGVDNISYPRERSVIFGLNLKF